MVSLNIFQYYHGFAKVTISQNACIVTNGLTLSILKTSLRFDVFQYLLQLFIIVEPTFETAQLNHYTLISKHIVYIEQGA